MKGITGDKEHTFCVKFFLTKSGGVGDFKREGDFGVHFVDQRDRLSVGPLLLEWSNVILPILQIWQVHDYYKLTIYKSLAIF